MYKFRNVSSLVLLQTAALIWSSNAYAEEHTHRQHGTHEHGVAQMNIAKDGDSLQIEFSSPAMNIVGFEHAPRTEQQRKAVKQAVSILEDATQLFVLTPAANCKLVHMDVETSLKAEAHSKHANHDTHEHENSHADFHAEYSFKCLQMPALSFMEVVLFKQFPATEDVDVKLLTEKGQTALELNAKSTRVEF